jgi:hypothetical protein
VIGFPPHPWDVPERVMGLVFRMAARLASLLVVTLALAGCDPFAVRLQTHTKPDTGKTYAYAYCSLSADSLGALNLDVPQIAGVLLYCDSGEQYVISCSHENPVQLIEVAAASTSTQCSLTEIVFYNSFGKPVKRSPTPIATYSFALESGSANYVGDVEVEITGTPLPGKIRSDMRYRVGDRYEATTRKLAATYPSFTSVRTRNALRSGGAEDLVNCASGGVRTWTSRSKCD